MIADLSHSSLRLKLTTGLTLSVLLLFPLLDVHGNEEFFVLPMCVDVRHWNFRICFFLVDSKANDMDLSVRADILL